MFDKTPRLGCEDFLHLTLIIKRKQDHMINFFLILKPFVDLQSDVKVLAIASMLRARLVKNLTAKINSVAACSSFMWKFDPSHSGKL